MPFSDKHSFRWIELTEFPWIGWFWVPKNALCFGFLNKWELVGGFNHLEKYESQWEGLSHTLWNIKNVWNHQPEKSISAKFQQGNQTHLLWQIRSANRCLLDQIRGVTIHGVLENPPCIDYAPIEMSIEFVDSPARGCTFNNRPIDVSLQYGPGHHSCWFLESRNNSWID
jgi:hypothetical protein